MKDTGRSFGLYIIYILALLPVFIFRDYTPDNELRYLSIVDESLANHRFLAFTNQGIPYADKPPLYLWGLMLFRWLAGAHYMWLYGFFTIIPAIIILRVFDKWTSPLIPSEGRIASQLMLLSTGLFLASTIVLRMDMLMCMWIVLAFYEFWKIYETGGNNSGKHQWLFPVYVFLAVFSKGPLGIIIPIIGTICFLLWEKKYRIIAKVWGWRCWAVLIPACALWFVGVYIDGGQEYLDNLLFHQTMGRAVKSFHHAAPFYYYLICIWYCLIPWTLAILGQIVASRKHLKAGNSLQTFFIIVAVSTIVFLSCISAKIQIYMLPAIPFIIYACAIALPRYQENRLVKLGMAIISVIFVLVFPALIVVKIVKPMPMIESFWWWPASLALTAGGILTLSRLYSKISKECVYRGIKSMSFGLLATLFFAGFAMPSINYMIGYGKLSAEIARVSAESGISDIRCWQVKRPENMDVYIHKKVNLIEDDNYSPGYGEYKKQEPYILVTKTKYIDQLGLQHPDTIGKYCVTVIGAN